MGWLNQVFIKKVLHLLGHLLLWAKTSGKLSDGSELAAKSISWQKNIGHLHVIISTAEYIAVFQE